MNLFNHIAIKLFLLLITFCLIPISKVKAQDWAPIGSKWHYTQLEFSQSPVSYRTFETIGNTIINGINCKMIEHKINDSDTSFFVRWEYMYSDSGKVFHYHQVLDTFYVLYDFNALAGESWVVIPPGSDSSFIITVDSTNQMIINNDTLKVLYAYYESGYWIFGGMIIENIGSTNYMFPQVGIADPPEGGPLRCYQDTILGLYETGVTTSCDYITGIEEIDGDYSILNIYPNPASYQSINLEYELNQSEEIEISIFDNFGKIVKKINNIPSGFGKHTVEIDISGLPSGLYLCRLKSGSGHVVAKFSVIK